MNMDQNEQDNNNEEEIYFCDGQVFNDVLTLIYTSVRYMPLITFRFFIIALAQAWAWPCLFHCFGLSLT